MSERDKMGEVCTVIGAGPGLGLAVARRFGRGGYRLALLARTPEALDQQVSALAAEGLEARAFAVDAGQPASLASALAAVEEALGPTAVLVYNAALAQPGRPTQLTPESLASSLQVNTVGALAAARAVLPGMCQAGRGSVLLTGGGLALHPSAEYTALSIGKAAIRQLAFCLAEELEPLGVHVATVTISGQIQPGTHFDPDTIAEQYWRLHEQPRDSWEREIAYR